MTTETLDAARPTIIREVAQNDFAALSGLMLDALSEAASEGRSPIPASLGVEFTCAAFPASHVACIARVERATRTLVFVEAEARDASGVRLCVASGVFKVA